MLALGIPTGPITAVLIGALMIHGVPAGPQLITEHRDLFWGFVASMYVGNLMLLVLNLPLVGMFVSVLRIPYGYLYPLIIMFCIVGVYEVNHSIVDVWIMLIMGALGYALRKFDFDPAPLVLGLVIAPIFEQSLAPVADHVERQLLHLLQPADLGRRWSLSASCCWRCRRCPSCSSARTGATSWPKRKPANQRVTRRMTFDAIVIWRAMVKHLRP